MLNHRPPVADIIWCNMGAFRFTVVVLLLAAIVGVLNTINLLPSRPAVQLTVVGYTTNQLSDGLAARFGKPISVCAVVAITNRGTRPITFFLRGPYGVTDYRLLHRSTFGWSDSATGLAEVADKREDELFPGDGFTFEAFVDTNEPCRVTLNYGTPSRFWHRLPRWLTCRLPWATTSQHRAMTDIIDLRSRRL